MIEIAMASTISCCGIDTATGISKLAVAVLLIKVVISDATINISDRIIQKLPPTGNASAIVVVSPLLLNPTPRQSPPPSMKRISQEMLRKSRVSSMPEPKAAITIRSPTVPAESPVSPPVSQPKTVIKNKNKTIFWRMDNLSVIFFSMSIMVSPGGKMNSNPYHKKNIT